MLRRSPIRTKMITAFLLLLAIICVLTLSSAWGLKRYRQLAGEVSQRADEMPLAYDLYRKAEALHDSHNRITDLRRRRGMIDASLLNDPLIDYEESAFEQALVDFNLQLQRYESLVSAYQQRDRDLLVDTARQQRSLGEIRIAFRELEGFHHEPHLADLVHNRQLSDRHDSLVAQTDQHFNMINASMEAFSDEVAGQYRTWIAVTGFCFAGACLMVGTLLLVLRSQVVKPFRTLLVGSRLVASGQLGHRIDLGTRDELSELAEAMNHMTDRFQKAYENAKSLNKDLDKQVKDRTREVIQNEQLASVGFLAAGVAHEINNPLATIAWSAESLESRVDDYSCIDDAGMSDGDFSDVMRTNLRRIQEEAYRCKGITERLLDFSRLGEVRRASTDMGQLVEEVIGMVSKVGEYRCKTLRTHCDSGIYAHVNSHEIRQVVLNLLTNALESVDCDGAVDVYVQPRDGCAYVGVWDDGCGMNEEVLAHLFEPFFTRRRDGTGTGLGLSITYRIVSQHHGSLTAHSDGEGRGSRLEMLLPIEAEQPITA